MVPPASDEIPRVSSYSGAARLTATSLTRLLRSLDSAFHPLILLALAQLIAVLNPSPLSSTGLASCAFARHYSRNLV